MTGSRETVAACLCLAISALGCEPGDGVLGSPIAADGICGQSVDRVRDEAVFQALTESVWTAGNCSSTAWPPPTCHSLSLGADGHYSWSAYSDYAERMEAGAWNFRARDASSGILCFENGSVMPFSIEGGGVHVLHTWQPLSPNAAVGTRDSLPSVLPSDLYMSLVAQPWDATSNFDLDWKPTRVEFLADGSFSAVYRDGECSFGGTWGVDGNRLYSRPDPNSCDGRGGSSAALTNGAVWLSDDRLHLGSGLFRPGPYEGPERSEFVPTYGSSSGLVTELTWRDDFVSGEPKEVTVTIRAVDPHAYTVTRFAFTTRAPGDPGDAADVTVFEHAAPTSIVLGPDTTHSEVVTITMPATRPAELRLWLEALDDRHSWYNGGSFYLQ